MVVTKLFADRVMLTMYPHASKGDRVVFAFYALTVICCLGTSALFHTFLNHSAHMSDLWARFDYCGIMLLIFGDFVTGIYMGFYCEPILQVTYWTMITVFTAATAFVVLSPSYQSRQYRLLRLCCFVATGLSACAPIVHAMHIFPAYQLGTQSGLHFYYVEGAIVLLAALIYATRFPEAWRPGKHDIFGSSHYNYNKPRCWFSVPS